MRVTIITLGIYPFRRGGLEVHTYEHATRLARSGHQVQVFTKRYRDTAHRAMIDGVEIEEIGSSIPFLGPLLFVVLAFARLARQRSQIDIIHVHFATYFLVPAYLMSLMYGTPYIVTCHGFDVIYLGRSKGWKGVQSRLLRAARMVTTTSNDVKAILVREHGILPGKITVVHNGVDHALVDRLLAMHPRPHPKKVVFVGNLRREKDPLTALEAFKTAHETDPELRLFVVGGGPLRGQVRDYVLKNRLEDCVSLLGTLGHEDTIQEMSTSWAFLMSSISEGGNPLALMEAMSLGRVVLSTEVGGVKDVVVDGENGILTRPGSPKELAAALLRVCEDKTLAAKIGLGALSSSRQYTWERVAASYEEIYNGVVTRWQSADR